MLVGMQHLMLCPYDELTGSLIMTLTSLMVLSDFFSEMNQVVQTLVNLVQHL